MANWSFLNATDSIYNPGPGEYSVNPVYQGKYLVPIFWYLIFESDDFTIYEQELDCEKEGEIIAPYAGFATDKNSAIDRLRKRSPHLKSYFSDNIMASLDGFVACIESTEQEHISIEAREISLMYEEPQQFADKAVALLTRMNMACSNDDIEYDRKDLIRTVLDAELRQDSEGICFYKEVEGKFDAAPAFFVGVVPD